MTMPLNIKNPCNCYGVHGEFELEQAFHEMGIPGCQNSGRVPSSGAPVVEDNDPVTKPNHYRRFKIEPVRFIMENQLPFWMGNVIKYILRQDAKNGLEDMKKARRYLDMEIARMEGNGDFWT